MIGQSRTRSALPHSQDSSSARFTKPRRWGKPLFRPDDTRARAAGSGLSAFMESTLARRVRKGDRAAHHQMVLGNLNLVKSVAGDYLESGLDPEDVYQAGVLGLMRACDDFDPEAGARLATYAIYWIRAKIHHLIERSTLVRIPKFMRFRIVQLQHAIGEAGPGVHLSDEAIGTRIGLSAKQVRAIRQCIRSTVSFDRTSSDDPDEWVNPGDVVDGRAADPSASMVAGEESARLDAALSTLAPFEQWLLRSHCGLDCHSRTMAQLAADSGYTRQRIQQVRAAALVKLRALLADE